MTNLKQEMRFMEFLLGDNTDFYEGFLKNLSEEELESFLEENSEYHLTKNREEE